MLLLLLHTQVDEGYLKDTWTLVSTRGIVKFKILILCLNRYLVILINPREGQAHNLIPLLYNLQDLHLLNRDIYGIKNVFRRK